MCQQQYSQGWRGSLRSTCSKRKELKTKVLIEEEGYQVIYGDTDSIFVWLNLKNDSGDVDQLGKFLADKVNSWWKNYLVKEYQLESALELEYENHYTRFLMPTIRGSSEGTKKRYAGMICKESFNVDDTIELSANAIDDNGSITKVEFSVNGALVGEDFTEPYSIDWTVTQKGAYNIKAVAYNAYNN